MKNYCLIFIIVLLAGCTSDVFTPQSLLPVKAALTFPAKDAICTTGTVLSATQSSITFTWNAAANTTSYEFTLKNLITAAIITQTTANTQLTITLLRNTPYSWYVTSKSTKINETAKSEVWKFYNSGPATVSYPPFPADIITPVLGQNLNAPNGKINLTWAGNDVDNDIATYDVYFGETSTPILLQANIPTSFLNDVSVTSNKTYYWKVITKDSAGNRSSSILSQFKIN